METLTLPQSDIQKRVKTWKQQEKATLVSADFSVSVSGVIWISFKILQIIELDLSVQRDQSISMFHLALQEGTFAQLCQLIVLAFIKKGAPKSLSVKHFILKQGSKSLEQQATLLTSLVL